MRKLYSVSAIWRKKDVNFLNTLKISRVIEEGMCVFSIEEGDDYNRLINFYSKNNFLLGKTRPKEFEIVHASCIFSTQELDNSDYYALGSIYQKNNGFPEPQKALKYQDIIFEYTDKRYGVNKKQIAPFRVKKPKYGKKYKGFYLDWEFEFAFFKKDFFDEVLAPLGLQSMEVLDYKTRKPLEDTVQLIIPLAKSKLLLENSAYDIHAKEETGGYKQYALQTLDFFPPFEKDFDFHICYSQEELLRGHRKIIISKEFCKLLVKHNIIEYSTDFLTPLRKK